MNWKQLLNRKSMETLQREMAGEHRLRRALGPIQLTALAIGAIIGAGIFVMTGAVAKENAGPAVLISFVVAGIGCGLAALCYSEFAAMVPIAGSAYTYAYATLGELFAWIIGWDLILEYAMSCATVAAAWTKYFDAFLRALFGPDHGLPLWMSSDPFSKHGAIFNLPAVCVLAIVTVILVIGIRESATTNAILVGVKLFVVLFVILVGVSFINPQNWTGIPPEKRFGEQANQSQAVTPTQPAKPMSTQEEDNWGLLGAVGLDKQLAPLDEHTRSSFAPFGFSGIMLGAALVFFAYIGFDSISTNAEEAKNPQRDLPIGIISSLVICTVLYILVALVITGMEPYYKIDGEAAIATAFQKKSVEHHSLLLRASAGLIATGALAGMSSVLLVTFLSQARIFLAMARDRLLPHNVFGVIHPKFQTPHRATILTGAIICVIAAFTPISDLEKMVNIGTLMAFIFVCAAVLLMRIRRPEVKRPFRCPAVYIVAPLGIAVNLFMTLFLPVSTWLRLVFWLIAGLILYFAYGHWHSLVGVAGRVLNYRRSYRDALEKLAAHYEHLAEEYGRQGEQLEKGAAESITGAAADQGSFEQDAQRKQHLAGEYRRLVSEYHALAQQTRAEIADYEKVRKPQFAFELPVNPAPALLHQLQTQGASPTDGPMETVDRAGSATGIPGEKE